MVRVLCPTHTREVAQVTPGLLQPLPFCLTAFRYMEPFAGAVIGPFTVLSPPRHIYPQLVSHFPDTPRASGNMSDFADQGILKGLLDALAKAATNIWEAWGFERLRDGGETGAHNESSVVLYGQFDG